MKDIERELGLNRHLLIASALLLGSDYTLGVKGVGIVNTSEILNAFVVPRRGFEEIVAHESGNAGMDAPDLLPPYVEEGLEAFKQWVQDASKDEAKAKLPVKKKLTKVREFLMGGGSCRLLTWRMLFVFSLSLAVMTGTAGGVDPRGAVSIHSSKPERVGGF